MKVAFYTLGCKVNSYETEASIESFFAKGFEIVDFEDFSDIYIINTCMVTNMGERKSKKIIRRPYAINKEAIVIVMGCLSQLKAEEILAIDGVKIVLGTTNRDKILDYLNEYLEFKQILNKVEVLKNDEKFDNLFISDFKGHQRAFLKIQDGCNNFCSYCIIPYTRGRIRSKAKDIVLKEAKQLVESGHIEIVLTGIHTGGYGEDLEDYSFAQLLKDLETVEGLKRVRISSIEITELTDEVIEIIKNSKIIVNHIHIPLQGGNDKILKAMNRKYTTKEYKNFINKLRDNIKDLAVTTDIIVGFPGETDEDFLDAVQFIKEINFQELHVFPFSRRAGTVADKLNGQVNGVIKKARVHDLLELSEQLKKEHIQKQLNRLHLVIPEQMKDGLLQGHTRDYIKVCFKGDESLIGQEIPVMIKYIGENCNLAEMI
ncbi:MAG: tRNA (N(6)-L-threonylcarbamoyladenosine(37)-C(2))-methylthiotransferase MtaB [Tenericutes bacterium]|nr:tRNA (N(6)-L-threonylcarbamoyladenosine(37)-C(2))-methylthiotransferase MtaB [Mycoplasmatota bacterium]